MNLAYKYMIKRAKQIIKTDTKKEIIEGDFNVL